MINFSEGTSTVHTLKTIVAAAAVLAGSLQVTIAGDAVWRSSKPWRVSAVSSLQQGDGAAAQSVWDRIEYPLLWPRTSCGSLAAELVGGVRVVVISGM